MADDLKDVGRVLDGIANQLTLMGSRIDPNQGNEITANCDRDRFLWYENGGLADKIANFWGDKIGTGLEISVAARTSGRSRKDSAKLQDWLQSEYERLDVLGTFKAAQLQCNLDRAAPILIWIDDSELSNLPPKNFDRVVALKVCQPTYFIPATWLPIMGVDEPIDHRFVTGYQYLTDRLNPLSVYHADRVLAMQGRKLVASVNAMRSDYLDLQWGLPLISTQTIEAAIKYDLAVSISMVLLHAKNTIVYKFKGLFASATSANSEEMLAKYTEIARRLQSANKINNIVLTDLEMNEIDVLERNLSEVANITDRVKDYLLANCPSIPQSHLFGRHERTGGLSASNNEAEDVNATAQLLYRERWLPLLNKLNRVLLSSSTCPVKNANPSDISVIRKSGFTPDPTETAKMKLIYTQIDKLLMDKGAIEVKEMRARHIGTEFKTELLLESADIPTTTAIEPDYNVK